jgi:hypothetical protein
MRGSSSQEKEEEKERRESLSSEEEEEASLPSVREWGGREAPSPPLPFKRKGCGPFSWEEGGRLRLPLPPSSFYLFLLGGAPTSTRKET